MMNTPSASDFSFWEQDVYSKAWDICIVGSGINGLSAGISILQHQPQASVLIVDRSYIPLGASTRNAGFACFGSPSEILADVEHLGEKKTIDLIRMRWNGLKILRHRLENSRAGFTESGGYELFNSTDFSRISGSLPFINELISEAIDQSFAFQKVSVPDGMHGFDSACFNPLEGQLHPGWMMEHLKNLFLQKGGVIHTGIDVHNIETDNGGVILHTVRSVPIKCRNAVISTNGFSKPLLPQCDVSGARNHVIVTAPVQNLPWKGCFHYDQGYIYFRNVGNRILLGGARNRDLENEQTASFGSNPVIVDALESFLYEHLASRDITIAFRWSGIIGVGEEKLPIVKEVLPGVIAGVRCSGMGIALASLMGEEVARLLHGNKGMTPSVNDNGS